MSVSYTHLIDYYSELESKIADIMTAHDAAARAVKDCLLYTSVFKVFLI